MLDDCFVTLRTLLGSRKLDGHDVTIGTDVADVSVLDDRLEDSEILLVIRKRADRREDMRCAGRRSAYADRRPINVVNRATLGQ